MARGRASSTKSRSGARAPAHAGAGADPLVTALVEGLGRNGVARGPAARAFLGRAAAAGAEPVVVRPTTNTEVQHVLDLAREGRVPVFIAGSSSRGMRWDRLKRGRCLVLDLARLDAILAVDDVSLTVTTQTGITWAALERSLVRRGFTAGFSLGGFADNVSVGGMLATGLPPLASPAHGTAIEQVVNVAWVAPDGTAVRTRITPRAATGPDLDALVLGARGTLGVITEATLRIHRDPEERQLLGFGFRTTSEAILTLGKVVALGLPPLSAGVWPASPGAKRGARLAVLYGGSATWTRSMSGAARKAFKELGARIDPKPDASWFAHVDAAARAVNVTEPVWAYGSWNALARAGASPALMHASAGFGVPCFDAHGGYAVANAGDGEADRVRAFRDHGCVVLRSGSEPLPPFPPAVRALLTRLKARLDPANLLNRESLG